MQRTVDIPETKNKKERFTSSSQRKAGFRSWTNPEPVVLPKEEQEALPKLP